MKVGKPSSITGARIYSQRDNAIYVGTIPGSEKKHILVAIPNVKNDKKMNNAPGGSVTISQKNSQWTTNASQPMHGW